jgi:6-pyruvoyltetrahydropterin/6-carboxytetrahydropterin synthase
MRYRSTKRFTNLPCAHRLHSHPGHCRFVHGYSRSFKFYFEATHLDEHNFVVDFAALKDVKQWLDHMYDHTLLIGEHDPELAFFREMNKRELCDLRVVPSVTMEGTAQFVFDHVDELIKQKTSGRAWVAKVEVHENDKNSAELERVGPLNPK